MGLKFTTEWKPNQKYTLKAESYSISSLMQLFAHVQQHVVKNTLQLPSDVSFVKTNIK